MSEIKEKSQTELFKEWYQRVIFETTGEEVSKSKAWELFKATQLGVAQYVAKLEGENKLGAVKKLALAGVGSFEVQMLKPSGKKAGESIDFKTREVKKIEGAKIWEYVPKFKVYPSSKIQNIIEQMYGLEEHGLEIKAYGTTPLPSQLVKTDVVDTEEKEDVKEPAKVEKKEKAAKKEDTKEPKTEKKPKAPKKPKKEVEIL